MRRLAPVLLLALVSVVVLAACGGDDDDGDGGGDFVAEANDACADRVRANVEGSLEVGVSTTEKQSIENLKQNQIPAREEFVERLKQLEPPAADRARFEKYVAGSEALLAAQREAVRAFDAGDRKAFEAAGEKVSPIGDQNEALAKKLGLDDCAQKLPADDAKAAEAVVREFETTSVPRTSCKTLVTPQYAETQWPKGFEQCARFQRETKPEDLADDIKVSNVEGVDDIVATIDFEDVGGQFAGEPGQGTLYYLDGKWKLFNIAAAS